MTSRLASSNRARFLAAREGGEGRARRGRRVYTELAARVVCAWDGRCYFRDSGKCFPLCVFGFTAICVRLVLAFSFFFFASHPFEFMSAGKGGGGGGRSGHGGFEMIGSYGKELLRGGLYLDASYWRPA